MKAEIYQSLYSINESLQAVSEHLERLKIAGVLNPSFAEIHQCAAHQLRAEINQTATINLHTCESQDAYHLEQLRLRQEKQLRGMDPIQASDSVLLLERADSIQAPNPVPLLETTATQSS